MPKHIFRKYDIRGVASEDLTDPVVRKIGRGLATLLPDPATEGEKTPMSGVAKRPRIVVARDCRLSGPRLLAALTQGLIEGGVDVVDVGVGPTPLLYFAARHLGADGGVMITGSHNPAGDNGFKLVRGTASFFGEQIEELARYVEGPDHAPPGEPGTQKERDVREAYLEALTSGIRLDRPEVRVVIDAGNGSAGPLGQAAFERIGLKPTALYCDMDGTFPNHHPDPTVPENLTALCAQVKAEGALAGLAWDGDGDRLGVVDADGSPIWGDRLLALFARRILETQPGATVIGDVKCSQSLFADVAARGGRPIMWKTGHSLIKAKMKEEQAAVAGEMSGHFFFADRYFGFDDGIYAALRIVEILAAENKTIGELLSDLPERPSTPELRVDCPDAHKFDVVRRVQDHYRGKQSVDELDGARVTYADGAWGLVRASNTGPVIVTRFEAPTTERLDAIRREVEAVIERAKTDVLGT